MIYIWLNLMPILVATALGIAIAALYRIATGQRGGVSPGLLIGAVVGEFWLASILAGALILAPNQAGPWVMAIGTGVVIWAGFVLPTVAITLRHRAVSARATAGDCGYWLVTMVAQAIIMKLIGLAAPIA